MNNNPIGIFDSGIGGLSVFSKLIKLLPDENYIYFGDTLNSPYGNKTKQQLIEFASDIFDFFKSKDVKAVIMACNTTSATVYDILKLKYKFEIYPIVQSVSSFIAKQNYNKIGIFATNATVNSHAYRNFIAEYNKNMEVIEIACPIWASIVENSLLNDENSIKNIQMLMNKMMKNNVEKIVLGCTHYPCLINILADYASKNIFIDPAEYFAQFIAGDLAEKNLLNDNSFPAKTKFYVSSNSKQFIKSSELFFKVENAEEISLKMLNEEVL